MGYTKIDNADLVDKGVIGLPDRPGLSTAAMQNKLEETARDVIIPKFNNLIDEMGLTDSAGNLGATPLTGRTSNPNVQAVMEKLSTDLKTVEDGMAEAITDAHTHDNKALLDTYTQTETDLADAVSKKHDHANKALLDTYTQSETDLASAVADDHTHSNKALLDTYTQSDSDLGDAVSKKHDHSNKALLDTYTQTETDLADAVSKKHDHSNKACLDKFSEVSGDPYYDGNPIGGGGSGDTFKTIQAGGTSFVASGADTFKINAGSNVTITALSSPDKGFSISATGGGSSTGDMLMSDYDNSGDVKAASSTGNGIKDFIATEIGKLDVSDSAVSGKYVSAVSETDGKISVTREDLPVITDTYDGTSSNGMSGKAVKSAIDALDVTDSAVSGQYVSAVSETDGKISVTRASLPTVPTTLASLTGDVNITTPSNDQVLKYDYSSSKWVNGTAPAGGHTMIDNSTYLSSLTAKAADDTDDDVASGYAIANWSNADIMTLVATMDAGDDSVGVWNDAWETDGIRTGWIWHKDLYHILQDNNVEIEILFDIKESEVVNLYAYRVDDEVQHNGVNGGAIAIKLNGAIQATTLKVAVNLKRQRTNQVNATIL